ncbi:GntR family transcriptional regulator [Pseudovibrio exalbescens]|uniref:GntR family transcriptional regulator n=1 Tax=Pseudovibrio exalbescens TaxID=197461 RepID=UPI0023661196|nr:GntR family transcriptional regulator [Pseudovibrio exalbescens]MDD7912051.1 GntR family transcriptional regulator [Pseudovibrio exalbescens]
MPKPSAGKTKRKPRAQNAPPTGPGRYAGRSGTSIADIIHDALRAAILTTELVPGTLISETELAEKHGVSRTPVREAVLRLSEEKLVEVAPKSGTFVARIPLSALPEALLVRQALEEVTVKAAIKFGQPSDFLALEALIEKQQEAIDRGDRQALHDADDAFHAGIAAAGGYSGIWELITQVKVHVDRYRRLAMLDMERLGSVIEEHRTLLQAMRAGDVGAAVGAMALHLDKLRTDMSHFKSVKPEFFIHDVDLLEQFQRAPWSA